MADSTVLLSQIETGQAQKEATANQLFDAMSVGASYGRHAETCAGLVWGYYGTRFGGTAIANGTNTCGISTTTYMVAHLTTGAVTFATTTTNWDTPATYGRCFKIVTGASAVISYEDHRFGPLGIINAAAVAGSGDMILASVQTVTGAKTFGSAGAVGKLKVAGTTSGVATIDAPAVAGTAVITLPGVTGTLATLAGTETLTNKSIVGSQLTGAYTAAGLTLATARLLGRTTAATGAAEEISIGSGLSMSAGSLTAIGSGGTVTHTGGALTSNAVVLGAGTNDAKVVAGIITDGTSKLTLGVAGTSAGAMALNNATSGTITLQPPTGALGTVTVTVPAATDTLANLAGTQAFTNKTYNGNTLTAGTYTLTGTAAKTLTFSNSITLAGTDSTTMTFPPASASVGYINIPQNSQSAAYTTVLADQGKHLLHPAADTTARTFTIDSNANVAFPVGTAITFVNENAAGVMTIAVTSDEMRLAGAGTTGSRTLAANGIATALKITATRWLISGTGLT